MMNGHEIIAQITEEQEGKRSVDHAGVTKWGVTLRFLQETDPGATVEDVEALSFEQACSYWYFMRWLKFDYARIENWQIARKVASLSFVMNPRTTHRLLQRALRSVGTEIDQDGHFGPITTKMVNSSPPYPLYSALCSEASGFFRRIHGRRPNRYGPYIVGWLNRSYAFPYSE